MSSQAVPENITVDIDRECPFDLTELTRDQQVVWDWAYKTGFMHGHEDGWKAADEEAAFIFQRAARMTARAANAPAETEEERRLRLVAQDEMRWRLWPEQMRREAARREAESA